MRIEVGPNVYTTVDEADREVVSGFNWRLHANGYVVARRGEMMLYLHRLIIGAGPRQKVDHVNGEPLDNRRLNLRIATSSENGANRDGDARAAGSTSRYKGVSWNAERSRWRAYIHVDGKTRSLGSFTDEDAAARAYNAAAAAQWGDFARLNPVPEGSSPEGE